MPYEQDFRNAKRQQMLAQMLMQQGQHATQGQQVGRGFVAPSKTASILGALQQIGGGYLSGKSENQMGTLEDQRKKQIAEQLAKMAGMQAGPTAAQAVEPAAPVMGMKPPPAQSGVDPRQQQMAAALQAIGGLPAEQQEAILGSQAMQQLFPKQGDVKYQDVGDAVAILQGNREVGRIPKGAAPQGKTDIQRNVEAAGLKGSDAEEMLRQYLEKQSTHAPPSATNVTLNTEKSLYGGLADERSKSISALHQAAQTAPQTIERADRVKELLKTVPYTGAAAEWKLGIGKAAKAAGFDYAGDDIANTEMLARELGQNVLDSVKSSGLAGSQGLTEGERKFLLQVIGGTIELDDKTLARVADLNQRIAKNTLQRWNAEAGRLDPEQLKTLGMTTIDMPAGTPAPSATPKLRQNPDGSYEYTP
jgi:hypothetical protein